MRIILIGVINLLMLSTPAGIPPGEATPSVEIAEEDWGIQTWSGIRLGQLSVVHLRLQDRMYVQVLSDSDPDRNRAVPKSAVPSCDGNCFMVSSFERGSRNALGGRYSSFYRAPSDARLSLRTWKDGQRALTMDFRSEHPGFCGMWVHLFDAGQAFGERTYMDVGPYDFLTFWVRGERGNERILLKVSDADLERKEDARTIGELGSFLDGGRVQNGWRRALIPLSDFPPNLNRRQLAGLVFEAIGPREGRIAIKDLAFCVRTEPLLPLSGPADIGKGSRKTDRAIWVWNTAEIISSAETREALADFCRRQGIGHVYLQLTKDEELGPTGPLLPLDGQWRNLLSALARRGVRAYALDGYKEFALQKWHGQVLDTIEKVIEYNDTSKPEERFAGIHLDIEPYLLPGFHGPGRDRIILSYLDLLSKIRARTTAVGLPFGVDIPFWYDTTDELTRRDFAVEFQGKSKPASRHVIDLADTVTVMDYRTFTFGADGIAAHVEDELEYAASAGKEVFVGLETIELPDEDLIQFRGEPVRGLPLEAPAEKTVVLRQDRKVARLWLVTDLQWEDFLDAMKEKGADPQDFLWWPVKRVIGVPSAKLTFARLGPEKLNSVVSEAEGELSVWPSFAGFALHDYISLQSLLKTLTPKD